MVGTSLKSQIRFENPILEFYTTLLSILPIFLSVKWSGGGNYHVLQDLRVTELDTACIVLKDSAAAQPCMAEKRRQISSFSWLAVTAPPGCGYCFVNPSENLACTNWRLETVSSLFRLHIHTFPSSL